MSVGANRSIKVRFSRNTSTNHLKCFLINARSLLNKLHLFKAFVVQNEFPEIIAITESWTSSERDSAGLLSVPGYTLFRADRESRGGGVLLYVRSNLNAVFCPELTVSHGYKEALCCRINLTHEDSLLICVIYRPESNTDAQNSQCFNLIRSFQTTNAQRQLIVGDFNFKDVNWSDYVWPRNCDSFMESVHDAGLYQFVTFATRERNTLDLVFSNEPYLVTEPTPVPSLGKSDHFGVAFKLDIGSFRPQPPASKRNFNKVNWDSFRLLLSALLQDFDPLGNPNDMWTIISDSIRICIQSFVPTCTSLDTWKPPWADARCFCALQNERTKLRKFQRSGNQTDLESYKIASERSVLESRRSVYSFESRLAENINKDPKSFWSYVHKMSKSRPAVGPLKRQDGSFTSTDKECADEMAAFFASVYKHEPTPITQVSAITESVLDNIVFSPRKISLALKKMNRFAAPGPDGIPPIILKECAGIIYPILSVFFNSCMTQHFVPSEWKSANVVPIHKKGSCHDPGNFRPISLTSVIGKVMESIIAFDLVQYGLANGLIMSSQFGFLPKQSCENQLLVYTDRIINCLNTGDWVDAVYLDFKKAFDRVPHKRLMNTLWAHGIRGSLLEWLELILSNRFQAVVIGDARSDSISVHSGVPQGSPLGPSIFLFFVNLIDCFVSGGLLKFADDCKLFRRISKHPTLTSLDVESMQLDLNELWNWSTEWAMEFNVEKCAIIHFGRSNPCHDYQFGGQSLEPKNTIRDLGVIISSNMKCSTHCADAVRRAEQVVYCIRRIISNKNIPIIRKLYKSMVRPILEYCCTVWCPHYDRDIQLVERVQRRVTRMVPTLSDLPYEERLQRFGIQSLETRRVRADLIFMYKMCHGLTELNIQEFFEVQPPGTLRGQNRLFRLKPKFAPNWNYARYSFSYRPIDLWNRLPGEVVSAPSLVTFKKLLHDSGHLPQ